MTRWLAGAGVLVFLWMGAGCAENAPTVPRDLQNEARGAVCQSLGAARSALVGLTDVNPATSVAELKVRKQQVDTLVEALRRANEVLLNERISQFISAYGEFSQRVDSAGTQATLGQAAAAVSGAAEAGVAALDQAVVAVPCSQ